MSESIGGGPVRQTPIEKFLAAPPNAGPAMLLDLGDGPPTEARVIRSLERRLAQIDQHAHGMTPEADEVRLALHAAAAQILDKLARARPRGARGAGPRRSGGRTLAMQLEQDAVLTLARYGGWNRRALRRLTMVALARGARPGELAGVLAHMAGMRGTRRPSSLKSRRAVGQQGSRVATAEPRATAMPEPEHPDDDDGRPLAVFVGALATVLTLVVAVAITVVAVTSSGSRDPDTDTPATVASDDTSPVPDVPMARGEEMFPWQGDEPASGGEDSTPAVPVFNKLSDALVGLDSCVAGLEVDPGEAVVVFEQALLAIGSEWCYLTASQRRAAQHDVVEFVYRAVQRPTLAGPVIDAVARGSEEMLDPERTPAADDVWPVSWSIGLLARLAREQDLGATAQRQVEQRLREFVGSSGVVSGGFEQGVHGALWALLPGMIATEPADEAALAWENWVEAATATGARERSIVSALEWVLVAGDEPEDAAPVRWAVDHLVRAADWGGEGQAQPWLVRMFDDTRVTTSDLHALTTAIVRRSAAPGVDITMTLPIRATETARASLRERYATAWGVSLDGPTLDDLATDWLAAAREALGDLDDEVTFAEGVARAAMLSRISEAAALRFGGRLDEAGIIIDEYDRPVELELSQLAQRRDGDRVPDNPGMSRWALLYLSAQRDFSERMRLLGEAGGMTIRERVDAEVLVTEAVRGSPAQARAAARSALLAQRPSAVITLAMLELAPIMPRTAQNAEIVASVTGSVRIATDDPDWRLLTRRQLVQAALEQLAAEGDDGALDSLATLLGNSHMGRAQADMGAVSSAAPASVSPQAAAAGLRVQWERRARQSGLGGAVVEIEHALARHASRQRLARGPVQAFAAEQLAAFELMSIVVGAERLDRGPEIRAVRERVREGRRSAQDVVAQILSIERGFIELWAIRLGEETP